MPQPAQSVQQALIYPAARIANIVQGAQRGIAPSDLVDMLQILNTMIDAWALQRWLVYRVRQSIFTIVAGQQDYPLGPGGQWDLPFRPIRIEFADVIQTQEDNLVPANVPTYLPLTILNPLDWFSIAVPSITSSIPQKLYYEPTEILGTVHLWPVPQITNKIALGIWEQLTKYDNLNEPVILPQGYLKAMQYNLAKELCCRPWHSGTTPGLTPLALDEARSSLAWVKAANRPNMDLSMRCEGAAQGIDNKGRWDITTNQYRWP